MAPARLEGYRRDTVHWDGPPIAALRSMAGSSVHAQLLLDVDPPSVRRLDRFEQVNSGLYQRLPVEVWVDDQGAPTLAFAYVAGPRIDHQLGEPWDRELFERRWLAHYLHSVIPDFVAQDFDG